ncbi:uncharacterized protein ARB_04334 [Trichophyton benhamiae CBS 112371]|uniref:Uncharacterized protein n=1 Tax=Arthroderma benhamiae (strain ATCC MYA-4681 / CBS 112371) TaxID=663331 RepID=D4AJ85_ARTBC|nr:uncharacterized protein ARB_04334 [Trichophyton benhamiae CBS 112371]EFE36808.1 hypothetical protein ARB_04334 [Trichophyton benhamiae CBS 112371]
MAAANQGAPSSYPGGPPPPGGGGGPAYPGQQQYQAYPGPGGPGGPPPPQLLLLLFLLSSGNIALNNLCPPLFHPLSAPVFCCRCRFLLLLVPVPLFACDVITMACFSDQVTNLYNYAFDREPTAKEKAFAGLAHDHSNQSELP